MARPPCRFTTATVCCAAGCAGWMTPRDARGEPKRDKNNPDPALRQRELCGLTLIWDLRPTGPDRWEGGFFYNPESGKTYSVVTEHTSSDQLVARVYDGFALIGETKTLRRSSPRHIGRMVLATHGSRDQRPLADASRLFHRIHREIRTPPATGRLESTAPTSGHCRPTPPLQTANDSGIVQEDGQIGSRVLGQHLKEHLGDPATMVRRMVDDMQQNGATAHRAFLAADEPEANLLLECWPPIGPPPSRYTSA